MTNAERAVLKDALDYLIDIGGECECGGPPFAEIKCIQCRICSILQEKETQEND